MSTVELMQEIKRLSNTDRLRIIEGASALIREDLLTRNDLEHRIRAAAEQLKDLYEEGGELTEWTILDSEEVVDDTATVHSS